MLYSAPTGPPINPRANPTNPTTVMFEWSEPHYSERNGMITQYTLEVCQTDPAGLCRGYTEALTSIYKSLHPGYEYTWGVAAHTAVGRGPYSSLIRFRMPEDGKNNCSKCQYALEFDLLLQFQLDLQCISVL